jgi:hypothetical protein
VNIEDDTKRVLQAVMESIGKGPPAEFILPGIEDAIEIMGGGLMQLVGNENEAKNVMIMSAVISAFHLGLMVGKGELS